MNLWDKFLLWHYRTKMFSYMDKLNWAREDEVKYTKLFRKYSAKMRAQVNKMEERKEK